MSFFGPPVEEDYDTPSQLAQELDSHKRRYESGRQNVIDRGTAKVQQLKDLVHEVTEEIKGHEDLLSKA